MLVKFAFCSQLFGLLILIYSFATSQDQRLRETLPPGWIDWWYETVELLEYCALHSPAIAKDMELIHHLHGTSTAHEDFLVGGKG